MDNVKVSLVQESPIFFDKKASLDKAIRIIEECGEDGSQIIVFPESFIPGYPRGFNFGAVVGSRSPEGRGQYQDFYNASIDQQGKEVEALISVAKKIGAYVIMGVTEKVAHHGSLYCTMLYISPYNGLICCHRKLKPTGTERIVWAESDGSTLNTVRTPYGIMGGLICWENYMPLARMALYQKGVQIYIAPTADSRSTWTKTMQHIAMEGRCFVLACNQYFTKDMMPEQYKNLVKDEPEEMCRGGSIIISPDGSILSGPLYGSSGILTATLDLDKIIQSRLDFDPAGHYNRDDVFQFKCNGQPETIDDRPAE
jgi:nitrilase